MLTRHNGQSSILDVHKA